MTKHRVYSVAFKRQVAQEFLSGESGHSLLRRHGLSSRNLIRLWVAKYEAGDFEPDEEAADILQVYEGRIAALERLAGRQALELEFLKGAAKNARSVKSEPTSVISGPPASPSGEDAS